MLFSSFPIQIELLQCVIYGNASLAAHSLYHSLKSVIHSHRPFMHLFVLLRVWFLWHFSGLLAFFFSLIAFQHVLLWTLSSFFLFLLYISFVLFSFFFLRIFVFSAQGLLWLNLAGIFSWPRCLVSHFYHPLTYFTCRISFTFCLWPLGQTSRRLYIQTSV